jgi:hypothetical protein
MPLKLLEHVLPWFVVKLNDAEAASFLQNMQLAGICILPSYFSIELYNSFAKHFSNF